MAAAGVTRQLAQCTTAAGSSTADRAATTGQPGDCGNWCCSRCCTGQCQQASAATRCIPGHGRRAGRSCSAASLGQQQQQQQPWFMCFNSSSSSEAQQQPGRMAACQRQQGAATGAACRWQQHSWGGGSTGLQGQMAAAVITAGEPAGRCYIPGGPCTVHTGCAAVCNCAAACQVRPGVCEVDGVML